LDEQARQKAYAQWRNGNRLRAVLWRRWSIAELLQSYGTAGGSFRLLGRPDQAYLPGLA